MTTTTPIGRWGIAQPARTPVVSATRTATPRRAASAAPATPPANRRPLTGRRIALGDAARLDLFAALLEARGAEVVRTPLSLTRPAAPQDQAACEAWLDALLRGEFHDTLWTTPEGVRETFRLAADRGLDWRLVAALARVRTFAAGLATARALRLLGVAPTHVLQRTAPGGDADLTKALRKFNLVGRVVGAQLHAPAPSDELLRFLLWMRADARPAYPCQPLGGDEQRALQRTFRMVCTGQLDAIAFADAAEARTLQALAAKTGQTQAFRDRLAATHVLALSPRVAEDLRASGITPDIVPERTVFVLRDADSLLARLAEPAPLRPASSL